MFQVICEYTDYMYSVSLCTVEPNGLITPAGVALVIFTAVQCEKPVELLCTVCR